MYFILTMMIFLKTLLSLKAYKLSVNSNIYFHFKYLSLSILSFGFLSQITKTNLQNVMYYNFQNSNYFDFTNNIFSNCINNYEKKCILIDANYNLSAQSLNLEINKKCILIDI